MNEFFNENETKNALNIPEVIEFRALNSDINQAFHKFGDRSVDWMSQEETY